MSTERLRRELEALKARGIGECRGCGYPTYKSDTHVEIRTIIHKYGEPPVEYPPEYCEVCGREKRRLFIRMKGLESKSRGDRSAATHGDTEPHDEE